MTASTLNFVDLALLVIIIASIGVGVMRGATREVLGIAAWVGAFAVVFYGFPLLRHFGRAYIKSPTVADAVVGGGLFLLSLAVFILISRFLSAGVKGSILGGLDRSLGLVFGFIRGVLIVCLLYLSLGFFYPSDSLPPAIESARLMPLVSYGATELKHVIPEDYLPKDLAQPIPIEPLDAQNLLEETVKKLSTLNPSSPKPAEPQYDSAAKANLEGLIEDDDTSQK